MAVNIREQGHVALDKVADEHLPAVVRWLELLSRLKDNPDVEPEELWLLASGELEKMAGEVDDAKPIDDWRKYLDEF
jgi:hypothetical protein